MPQATVGGEPVSSTRVRRVIAAGEMRLAAALLGRPYSIEGEVDHGVSRGRALGAPTANLRLPGKLLPPDGVYLARAAIDGGEPLPAILNLGTSPTFGPGERRLEVHFLGFSGDLYGRRVRVFFERYLRHETRFPNAEALARQIRLDIARAERHFRGAPVIRRLVGGRRARRLLPLARAAQRALRRDRRDAAAA